MQGSVRHLITHTHMFMYAKVALTLCNYIRKQDFYVNQCLNVAKNICISLRGMVISSYSY